MQYIIVVSSLIFALCNSSCKQAESLSMESRIDSLLTAHVTSTEPGAVVLVVKDGKTKYAKAFGMEDMEANKPLFLSSNMRMASVSKQFTAQCILQLIEEESLHLEDDLIDFFPNPVFEGIQVHHLLHHTSGLASFDQYFEEDWDKSKIVQNKDILEWLKTNPAPLFAPGESWQYSNTAYIVLALLVEKVSGKDFATYAKEKVLNPIGMQQSSFVNLAQPTEVTNRAKCYEMKDSIWKCVDVFYMNGIMGDGALYTNANDFIAYAKYLDTLSTTVFKGEVKVPSDFPSQAFVKRFPFLKEKSIQYAKGWFVTDDYAFHTGGWYGTRTVVVKSLKEPLTIAVFRNSNQSVNDLINGVMDILEAAEK